MCSVYLGPCIGAQLSLLPANTHTQHLIGVLRFKYLTTLVEWVLAFPVTVYVCVCVCVCVMSERLCMQSLPSVSHRNVIIRR